MSVVHLVGHKLIMGKGGQEVGRTGEGRGGGGGGAGEGRGGGGAEEGRGGARGRGG